MTTLEKISSHELGMELRRRGHAVIIWSAEDVLETAPTWSFEQAASWLIKNQKAFQELQVQAGNEMLADLTYVAAAE